MAGNYWIKLYDEILDDPKMGTLPDRLYRRVIELFLIAGRSNKGGEIPNAQSIAWLLRQPLAEIQQDLEHIAAVGIIQQTETGWLVTKFAERQSPIPDVERKRHQRARDKREEYYGHEDVTQMSQNVRQITDTDTDTDTDTEPEPEAEAPAARKTAAAAGRTPPKAQTSPPRPNIFAVYEREIGLLTPAIGDELLEIEREYPPGWFELAASEAARNNARKLSYVRAILQRWKAEGLNPLERKPEKPIPRGAASAQPSVQSQYTLEQVNAMRADAGKPPITLEEYRCL